MPDEFYKGTDWEGSSGPIVTRQFAPGDLWPVGAGSERAGGDKDELADGLHPVVAIGSRSNRPINLTGVVVTFNSAANLATLNMADKVVVKNYVANVLTYDPQTHAPDTFAGSMAIGEPIYIDDSDALHAGVTLSRSPLNDNWEGNPLAGYLFYCQDEYRDGDIGGPNGSAVWPKTISDSSLVENIYCILLVNDCGSSAYEPR